MGRVDPALTERDRRAGDAIDREQIERERSRRHVDDRIDGPDLVEVDGLEADAVDPRLGATEGLEDRECALLDGRSEACALDQPADLSVMPTGRMGMAMTSGRPARRRRRPDVDVGPDVMRVGVSLVVGVDARVGGAFLAGDSSVAPSRPRSPLARSRRAWRGDRERPSGASDRAAGACLGHHDVDVSASEAVSRHPSDDQPEVQSEGVRPSRRRARDSPRSSIAPMNMLPAAPENASRWSSLRLIWPRSESLPIRRDPAPARRRARA